METRLSCLKNGPIEVRGKADITDANGHQTKTANMIHLLCRCGCSRVLPFCDGSHENISFCSE
jgi:CDGSH-type Zn-finger protein